MGLFGNIVKTVVNTVSLPVNVVKDVIVPETFIDPHKEIFSRTLKNIERLKDEASDD